MFIWIRRDRAASILKGEIQVRISRIQASIEARSLNVRAYTTFPAAEKLSFELIGAFVTNVILSSLRAYRSLYGISIQCKILLFNDN